MWQLAFSSKSVFQEDEARAADAGRRRRARPRRACRPPPAVRLLADQLGAGGGLDFDGARRRSAARARGRCSPRRERQRRADDALGAAAVGVVKTSSVGMLTTCRRPSTVSSSAVHHVAPGIRPTVRSVPGPRKRRWSKARSFSSSARATSLSMWERHAGPGPLAEPRRVGDASQAFRRRAHRRSTPPSPRSGRRGSPS